MAGLRHPGAIPGFFLASYHRYSIRRPLETPKGLSAIPDHLERDAFIMRLVARGVARYDEIRKFWDINEVMRANEHLDIQDDVDWLASREVRKNLKTGK